MKVRKLRIVPLAAALLVLSLASPLLAECQRCKYREFWWGIAAWCAPVATDGSEVGVTQCQQANTPVACTEYGDACSVINVPGGGGSGGGTGGGLGCTSTTSCPAECFSCGPRPLFI